VPEETGGRSSKKCAPPEKLTGRRGHISIVCLRSVFFGCGWEGAEGLKVKCYKKVPYPMRSVGGVLNSLP